MTTHTTTESDPFQRLINELAQPAAFPAEGGAQPGEPITIVQTHASAVLLTSARAYKIKKPLNLGFLDYSTIERRRQLCIEECAINQPLAPHIYLGIAPVLAHANENPTFGATYTTEQTPQVNENIQGSKVIDFAVVMRRLPEDRTLAALVQSGQATSELLCQIARLVARFHQRAGQNEALNQTATVNTALANILLTLKQSRDHIGQTISTSDYERIHQYITTFSTSQRSLLESRAHDGFYRDGHGDLRLEHIYALPSESGADSDALVIVDRIEFDPNYRIGDVASDIAFLIVELERIERFDLAQAFMQEYVTQTNDIGALEILPFYLVYRAIVRGHVRSLLLAEPGLDPAAHASIFEEAQGMYRVAALHAATPIGPTIVMIGGLMGSGKSTLAARLQKNLGWQVISSDQTRKRLAGLAPTAIPSDADQRRIYTAEWDAQVYGALVNDAHTRLANGHSVILDATYSLRERRKAAATLARETGARAVFLECSLPRDIAMQRLTTRWEIKQRNQREVTESLDSTTRATLASDGRPELYDQLLRRWEAFDAILEPNITHAIIDTSQPDTRILEQAMTALQIPFARLAQR